MYRTSSKKIRLELTFASFIIGGFIIYNDYVPSPYMAASTYFVIGLLYSVIPCSIYYLPILRNRIEFRNELIFIKKLGGFYEYVIDFSKPMTVYRKKNNNQFWAFKFDGEEENVSLRFYAKSDISEINKGLNSLLKDKNITISYEYSTWKKLFENISSLRKLYK